MQQWEGPLHPTHTCRASTPNLSESISSPPPVQSNHITLVSNLSVSLHAPPPFPFTLLSTLCLSASLHVLPLLSGQ